MAKPPQPDQALIRMPSFKAVRSFVAAAKYQSFTRAAEALCVTQAAISRQIRELETHLGTELFERSGREIRLTAAGASFFDAAQLSFLNIYQASERIRREGAESHSLTLCCSPAFAALCLSPRLKDFLQAQPEIELNVVTTQQFRALEPGFQPDIFVTQALALLPGYRRQALFHEVVYPVCTPRFLQANPQLGTLEGLGEATLLDLNPYGRSQMTELMDWSTWLAAQGHALDARRRFSSNDYHLLMQMVLADQGVALGWDHLVRPLVQQGLLVRPLAQELAVRNAVHYLVIHEGSEASPAGAALRDWLIDSFG